MLLWLPFYTWNALPVLILTDEALCKPAGFVGALWFSDGIMIIWFSTIEELHAWFACIFFFFKAARLSVGLWKWMLTRTELMTDEGWKWPPLSHPHYKYSEHQLMLHSHQKRWEFFARVDPMQSLCTDANGCEWQEFSPCWETCSGNTEEVLGMTYLAPFINHVEMHWL